MNYKNSTVLVLLLFLSHSFAAPTLLFKVQETPLAKKHTVWGRTGVNRVDQVLQRLQKNAVPLFTQADENLQRWYQIYFSSADSAEHTLEVLAGLPDLEYADLNRAFRLHDRPDDPRLDEQWALSRVQAFDAWDIEQGDAAIPIAIIDTGVDYKHKDLEANIWINPGEDLNGNGVFDLTDLNGIDDDGNGYIDDVMGWDFTDAPNYPDGGDYLERDHDPMDEHGHGTGVAGIVAAVSDNQIGISGLAPNCRIMNLRAFTANGYGEEDDVASAVLYAIENDARIINMSFGDVFVSRVLDDVIEYARKKDIIMVASAGNSSSDDVHYPSGFNATISVGSTDESDQLSGFSNYGSTIDLVAPGSDILSTDLNDGYRFWNGTSFSCPYVSAAAALLLSRNTALAAESIRGILVNSTDLIGGTDAWNPLFGSGRLNVLQALSKPVQSIVRITEPALDQGFATGPLMIRGSAWSPSFSEYSLYWGTGFNPDAWNPIIKGVTTPLIDSVLYVWDHLPKDGEYTLSLRVQNRDGAEERHQTRFFLDSTPPVISETALFPMIDGPNRVICLNFIQMICAKEPSITARLVRMMHGIRRN
ncbi:MAG: S8 family peptidase [candidate division KSB1 bacterium]|nr:S8 family peptidase [candidate division KSB1 bacterium]